MTYGLQRAVLGISRHYPRTWGFGKSARVEVAIYKQEPFDGAADATCAWGVVLSHQGDVRQCSAEEPRARPPKHGLRGNSTMLTRKNGKKRVLFTVRGFHG